MELYKVTSSGVLWVMRIREVFLFHFVPLPFKCLSRSHLQIDIECNKGQLVFGLKIHCFSESRIQLICNVTGQESDLVYWKWNGSAIEDGDPLLVEDYQL